MENNYMDPEYVPAHVQKAADMSVGAWIGTLILSMIPIVSIICLIVWAVSKSPEKRSRKNWAIAQIVLILIGLILTVLAFTFLGALMLDLLYELSYLL